jgi:hypothetical protein
MLFPPSDDPSNVNRPIGPAATRQTAVPSASLLPRVAAATGGRRWLTDDPRRLRQLMKEALDDLRVRYFLTYYPDPPGAKGWHEIRVRLRGARGDVLTRPGYLVP